VRLRTGVRPAAGTWGRWLGSVTAMALVDRLNVVVSGPADKPAIVFVHGFGCAQAMWRHVAPAFDADHRVVLFDLPGSGEAAASTYDSNRHHRLEGYRDDIVALLDELQLRSVVLVGHSVSAMIAVLVHLERPDLVERLVLVTPSARYLNDGAYIGGFTETDIDELLDLMTRNHLGWQDPLAAMVAGSDGGGVKTELERSFCRTRPDVAAEFAAVTFRGDNRADLPLVSAPTLILQSRDDLVAPLSAGLHVRDAIRGSTFVVLETRGHCPQLSAPELTAAEIRRFVGDAAAKRTA
jgi:sigma-B regulation protein RsbQ